MKRIAQILGVLLVALIVLPFLLLTSPQPWVVILLFIILVILASSIVWVVWKLPENRRLFRIVVRVLTAVFMAAVIFVAALFVLFYLYASGVP